MMRRLLLCFCILIVTISSQAQNNIDYQLHELSVDEYLHLIHNEIIQSDDDYGVRGWVDFVLDIIEMRGLSIDTASPDLLRETYQAISDNYPYIIDQSHWQSVLITMALSEGDLSFADDTFVGNDYSIDSTEIDLNVDGNLDYLLRVIYEPTGYEAYHVATQDEAGIWHITDTPLGANYAHIPHWMEDTWTIQFLEDINTDGLPEWVVVTLGHNTGGGAKPRSYMRIMAWRDGQLVNIAPDDFGFPNVFLDDMAWVIQDTNNDNLIDFARIRTHINNWDCAYDTVHPLEWNPVTNRYEDGVVETIIPETFGCLQQQAERAMWEADYTLAIEQYTQAFEQELTQHYWAGDSRTQYGRIRLALAYALSNDLDNAQQMLDTITTSEDTHPSLELLIERIRTFDLNTDGHFGLCETLYDFFLHDNYWIGEYVGMTLTDGQLSALNEQSRPNPNLSGCNLALLIQEQIDVPQLELEQSPSTLFEIADIALREELQADFNGDNFDDWLIFTEYAIPPYLFLSDSNTNQYHISTPDFPNSDDFEAMVMPYPTGDGFMVHYQNYEPPIIWIGYSDCGTYDAEYRLYYFQNDTLQHSIRTFECERLSFDSMISDDGLTLYLDQAGDCANEPTHSWIDNRYEANDLSYCRVYVDEQYDDRPHVFQRSVNMLRSALIIQEPIDDLFVDVATLITEDVSYLREYALIQAQYIYALALEALNRPDEALAQYIAIYEADPDSAWGKLAELHFEPVE